MRVALTRVVGFAVALVVAVPASAQFGHPLKGTWSGDWGTSKDNRTHIVLELNWDGEALSGIINPGPTAVAMRKAAFDPSTWSVHVEADGKDASGKAVHYAIDGKLENIGAYHRFITGAWTQGGVKGSFKVIRN
jgi:hypothetical protein